MDRLRRTGRKDEDIARLLSEWAARDAKKAEQSFRDGAAKILQQIDEFMNSRRRASLKAARDRLVAHALELTRAEIAAAEAGDKIALNRGDIGDIIEFTEATITDLESVFRGNHPNLHQFRGVWSRYSTDFWRRG